MRMIKISTYNQPGSRTNIYNGRFVQATYRIASKEASPSASAYSAYSTRSGFLSSSPRRVLPMPKNIHDYIDDFFEVGKRKEDTAYLSPRSGGFNFRNK